MVGKSAASLRSRMAKLGLLAAENLNRNRLALAFGSWWGWGARVLLDLHSSVLQFHDAPRRTTSGPSRVFSTTARPNSWKGFSGRTQRGTRLWGPKRAQSATTRMSQVLGDVKIVEGQTRRPLLPRIVFEGCSYFNGP